MKYVPPVISTDFIKKIYFSGNYLPWIVFFFLTMVVSDLSAQNSCPDPEVYSVTCSNGSGTCGGGGNCFWTINFTTDFTGNKKYVKVVVKSLNGVTTYIDTCMGPYDQGITNYSVTISAPCNSADFWGSYIAYTNSSAQNPCGGTTCEFGNCVGSICGCVMEHGGVITQISCHNANNGAINLNTTYGTSPYNYDWQDISGTSNSEDRTNLGGGTYTVTITDALGCTTTGSFTIINPAQLTVSGTITHLSCFGGSNGSINITASGGTSPYNYDWFDISGTNNSEDRSGLSVGT